ncbi:MAG: hypothetical protein IPM02_25165 [Betaproteobacteria bacterium]|nr:hypothetical protein [Betaproteobacteria bacterium]
MNSRALYLVRGAQRLPLGEFAGPFPEAARAALERYAGSLRRLELRGWAVEDDAGTWSLLSELLPKRSSRNPTALALAFD